MIKQLNFVRTCLIGIIWGCDYYKKFGEKPFGYYQLYYDGLIHNFGLGFCELYWHTNVDI